MRLRHAAWMTLGAALLAAGPAAWAGKPKVPRKVHEAIETYLRASDDDERDALSAAVETFGGDVELAAEALRTLPPLTRATKGTRHALEFESGGRQFSYSIRLPRRYDGKKRFPVLVLPDHGSVGAEAGISFWEQHKEVEEYVLFRPVIIRHKGDRTVFPDGQFFAIDQALAKVMRDALAHLRLHYAVDPERFSMTGLSQAGYYTWYFGVSFPDDFAALVPESSGGMAVRAAVQRLAVNLKDTRVRILHTKGDQITPYPDARNMANAIENADGDVELISYTERDYGKKAPPKLHPGPHDKRLRNVLPWGHKHVRTIPETFTRVVRYDQQGLEGRFRVPPPGDTGNPLTVTCSSKGGKLSADAPGVFYLVSPEDVAAGRTFRVKRKAVTPEADLELMLRTFKRTGDRGRLVAAEIRVSE